MQRDKDILEEMLGKYPSLKTVPIWDAYAVLLECCFSGGKILACGNGGSAADAEHIVGELMKGFRSKRPLSDAEKDTFVRVSGGRSIAGKLQKGIPAISLNSQTALMTAVGNDTDYDMVFAQQVFGYGAVGDVLIGMTTSGNSANVVNAAITAKAKGMKVIGITGSRDSELQVYSDVCLQLPAVDTYQVQEYTLPIYHALCAMLEAKLFTGGSVDQKASGMVGKN